MMIDNHDDDEMMQEFKKSTLPWYMLDADGVVVTTWNFIITMILIYQLIMVPFILVFTEVYMNKKGQAPDYTYEAESTP
jgi:hypothetical protein